MPDVLEDPEYVYQEAAARADFRSALSVPMLRDGQPIGAISVFRAAARPFPEAQIELLKTFADQAVIAIENVRLFNELEARNRDLTEALEQQTATSEILRVISQSPTDVQPVFDTIVKSAVRLCEARFGAVFRLDGEPGALGCSPSTSAMQRAYPMAPNRRTRYPAGRTILTGGRHPGCSISWLTSEYLGTPVSGWFSQPIWPCHCFATGIAIGAIVICRTEPGHFADKQIELLKTFADQAVIAIENVRLFTELEARTAELTRSVGELKALGEVGHAVSSTLDLETVLSTIVSRATS